MTAEAESIIPRRRNHPSLAIWGGGNELQWMTGRKRPLDEGHPVLAAIWGHRVGFEGQDSKAGVLEHALQAW